MTLDSRLSVVEQSIVVFSSYFTVFPTYSSSGASEDVYEWIQPSISDQAIDPSGSTVIDGIYAQTKRPETIPLIEPDLAWELEAWEAASDEALMLFEAGCE
jgi:hypothetical protein